MSISPAPGGGSAGATRSNLSFTNTAAAPCAITGWPGVSFVGGGDGEQVGPAAERSGTPDVITLGPGEQAVSRLTTSSPGPRGCSTPVDGLRVYPPNNTVAVFVRQAGRACADESLLTVAPVEAG